MRGACGLFHPHILTHIEEIFKMPLNAHFVLQLITGDQMWPGQTKVCLSFKNSAAAHGQSLTTIKTAKYTQTHADIALSALAAGRRTQFRHRTHEITHTINVVWKKLFRYNYKLYLV